MDKINERFPYLSKKDMGIIKSIWTNEDLPKKSIIVRPGFNNFNFFYIYSGIVRGYFITEKGEEITVFLEDDWCFFGAPESIFDELPTKYYFKTVTEVKLLKFNSRTLESHAANNNNILKFYLEGLKYIIATSVTRVESFISKNPEQRYLNLHLKRPMLINSTNKKEIACFLGILPNSLSRIIARVNKKK